MSLPGVPALPLGAAAPAVVALATEAITSALWQAAQSPPSWGVFDSNNNQVVSPDSVLEFDHRPQADISNFPVQDGSFASYNKVVLPFELQLRFAKGGSQSDRAQFLTDIDNLWQSTDLYTVITPERTYPSVNLARYEVARRGPEGAFFLTEVDLYFIQIIEVTPQYTTTNALPNAQSPAAQPVSNVGAVQPQALTPADQVVSGDALLSVAPGTF